MVRILIILGLLVVSTNASGQYRDTYKDIQFTELFRRSEGLIAGDGGYSIPVKGSKVIWLFGDSYIDCFHSDTKTVPCLFQARNAALVMDIENPGKQSTLKNYKGTPTYFHLGGDRKYWFWPSSGFIHGDTIYVFQSRIMSTGEPGMWGFEGVDSNYVAKINANDLSDITYSLLPGSDGINFGISIIRQGRFTLIFGIKSNGFGNNVYVARIRNGDIRSRWEYYNGEGWSGNIKEISKIFDDFTSSFSVCRIRNKYVMLSTEFSVDCDQGKNIFASVSDNPYGPFTGKHSVWLVDDTLNGHFPFFYMALAHPEFNNRKEELLVTYSINGYGKCVETCINGRMDPDVYRLKAIRIPFKILFAQ